MNGMDLRWMKKAACRNLGPDLFMPNRGENTKIKKAKLICKECPVMDECRDYGLALQQMFDTHGIFGGLTRQERVVKLRKEGIPVRAWGSDNMRINNVHGSRDAYRQHLFLNEPVCETCQKAQDARDKLSLEKLMSNHGTYAGWKRHMEAGEEPCAACCKAKERQKARYNRWQKTRREQTKIFS